MSEKYNPTDALKAALDIYNDIDSVFADNEVPPVIIDETPAKQPVESIRQPETYELVDNVRHVGLIGLHLARVREDRKSDYDIAA